MSTNNRSIANFRVILPFVLGISIGVTFTAIGQYGYNSCQSESRPTPPSQTTYYFKTNASHVSTHHEASDVISGSYATSPLLDVTENLENVSTVIRKYLRASHAQAEANELADEMFNKIRILCWVMTMPGKESEARAVKQTWGKRCNVFYFVSTAAVDNETTVIYHGRENRGILWRKTKLGFQHAYDKHFEDADWFVKADDDTYLIMENMRLLLLDKDPASPVYYGCKFRPYLRQGYMSGGAGYVLSKEALRRLVEENLPDSLTCLQSNEDGPEDVMIGICLEMVGVATGDSRDQNGKSRFFPLPPQDHVSPDEIETNDWYWEYVYYTHKQGMECCSDSAIGFHYIDKNLMWAMEYLIYLVQPFGMEPKLTGSAVKNDVIRYLNRFNRTAVTKDQRTSE